MLTILRPEICASCLRPLNYGVIHSDDPSTLTAFCTHRGCQFYNREFHWPAIEVEEVTQAALLRARRAVN